VPLQRSTAGRRRRADRVRDVGRAAARAARAAARRAAALRWFDQAAVRIRSTTAPLPRCASATSRSAGAPAGRAVSTSARSGSTWTGLPFAFAVWQVRRDADPAASG
jgi:hypothetical protein